MPTTPVDSRGPSILSVSTARPASPAAGLPRSNKDTQTINMDETRSRAENAPDQAMSGDEQDPGRR